LFSPGAKVDGVALAEARAGAEAADAGFVRVNVLHQREVAALNAKLGVIYDPAVLVFRRPYELFVKLDGFADKETVAQAATDAARPGQPAVG
jgi:predicted TIM-barrel enzyme